VGWGTIGATDGNSGVLRLEYATDQALKERAAIQLFVSAPRVRELAEGLTRLADQDLVGTLADVVGSAHKGAAEGMAASLPPAPRCPLYPLVIARPLTPKPVRGHGGQLAAVDTPWSMSTRRPAMAASRRQSTRPLCCRPRPFHRAGSARHGGMTDVKRDLNSDFGFTNISISQPALSSFRAAATP
jgi:hypothetical protein